MVSQSKIDTGGKNNVYWGTDVMENIIGTVCIILERKNYFGTCKVLKDQKLKIWMKGINKGFEMRGRYLMLRRGKGQKIRMVLSL